ncbi:hypothetical protein BJ742DRAFT_770683 [Cladochytrium replicatum]|nr:hypothetical protein BJ742DRAFT_770683 [Cladochytrium replicatum]
MGRFILFRIALCEAKKDAKSIIVVRSKKAEPSAAIWRNSYFWFKQGVNSSARYVSPSSFAPARSSPFCTESSRKSRKLNSTGASKEMLIETGLSSCNKTSAAKSTFWMQVCTSAMAIRHTRSKLSALRRRTALFSRATLPPGNAIAAALKSALVAFESTFSDRSPVASPASRGFVPNRHQNAVTTFFIGALRRIPQRKTTNPRNPLPIEPFVAGGTGTPAFCPPSPGPTTTGAHGRHGRCDLGVRIRASTTLHLPPRSVVSLCSEPDVDGWSGTTPWSPKRQQKLNRWLN